MTRPANLDSRLVRDNAQEQRDARTSSDVGRASDPSEDLSFEERMRAIRDSSVTNILPVPPSIPGYHLCWLSTTNTADSITNRVRQGWQPVLASELPSFGSEVSKDSKYDGTIAFNEMLLYKIPKAKHDDLMMYYHHVKPNDDENQIRQNVQNAAMESSRGEQMQIIQEGAFANLGKAPPPSFNC